MSVDHSRRTFLSVAAGSVLLPRTARSYSRILGANDRIQIGQIGCGHRAVGHRRMLKLSAETDPKFDFRSVCDLWTVNRQRAVDHSHQLFGQSPKAYKYSEEILADPQLDAVMIATGDHQHAKILAEVVKAGKDCYCEKPMANTIEDALLARDTVRASKQVVQMGSQWLSDPYQHRYATSFVPESWARSYLSTRAGTSMARGGTSRRTKTSLPSANGYRLGALVTGPVPRVHSMPALYFEFRLYKDFSGGITDQWYSHGSSLAHFYLDTFIPDETLRYGGHLSSGTTDAKIPTP